jgi:hypothetical protein
MREMTDRLDARACVSSYVILGTIFGFIFIFAVWQATVPGGDWRLTLLAGEAFALTMLWVATMRIQYSNGELWDFTPFTGKRTVSSSETDSAETKLLSWGRGSTIVLLLHRRGEKAQEPLLIKIRFSSKEDVGRLFNVLAPELKGSCRIGINTDETP